jgi:hypothetical protein
MDWCNTFYTVGEILNETREYMKGVQNLIKITLLPVPHTKLKAACEDSVKPVSFIVHWCFNSDRSLA